MRKIYLFLLFTLINSLIIAQTNIINVNAPDVVGVNEPFRISYEVKGNKIPNFQRPDFINFSLLDQTTSSSSNISIINGVQSSQSFTTFNYLLKANKVGVYRISPATVTINGRTYKSNNISIKVVSSNSSSNIVPSPPSSIPGKPYNQQFQPSQQSYDSDNLIIRATASKTNVYEQEAILLTYKIYTNTRVSGFHGKLPVLDGFHIQELDPKEERQEEIINGKHYISAIWKQYLLYPQSPGNFIIPSIECEAEVVTMTKYEGPFGMTMQIPETQTKTVKTSPIDITVNKLPESDIDYNGAVGKFSIKSSINKRQVKAGDIVSIKLIVNGVGNFKLFDSPPYSFPDDFETYDCKVTENFDYSAEGHYGSKTFEYIAVPLKEGNYILPPLKFSYFDLETKSFNTLVTPSYNLYVKGNVIKQDEQSEVDEINQDIRHIKTGKISLKTDNTTHLYSFKWGVAYIVSITLFIILYIYRKKIFNTLPSTHEEKRKYINKQLLKQFQKAKLLMENDEKNEFYDEILICLNNFIQNKLNIEKELFNKEYVCKTLEYHSIDYNTIETYLSITKECESNRFSPQSSTSSLADIYKRALQIITKIDSIIK